MSKWLLYFSCLPLLIFFWRHGDWQPLWQLLRRLRWLFISLFILHLWFHGADLTWIPSQAGLWIAIEKTFVLVFMVFTAHTLLVATPTHDLIAVIHWWFKPLNIIGFQAQTLAVRLALTLETLNHVHELYKQQNPLNAPNPIAHISQRATFLFQSVAENAEQATLYQFDIPQLSPPPVWQWMYPLSLILVMVVS
ncbi:hypothetical protein [Candidatus Albibeggiatoa sp. nov. NOAA]|uniref:hypothetical protein n=1 Tax=Candidatus Albibeggiatoa sp. nov. NOAA TaxID=3162724 RepID=UPI0032FDFB4A|nr:hypothetical protein [Thiotrichaceae bacterium]